MHKKKIVKIISLFLLVLVFSFSASFLAYDLLFQKIGIPKDENEVYSLILDEISYEKLTIETDENRINGIRCYAEDSVKGTVILVNGLASTYDQYLPLAKLLLENNWDVLLYNGTGIDDEGSVKGLSQSYEDLKEVLSWGKEKGINNIILFGHSTGGYAAASCADNESIKGVITMCSFDQPIEFMRYHAQEKVGFLADTQVPFLIGVHFLKFGRDGFIRASDVLLESNKPFLVFQSSRDTTVNESVSIGKRVCERKNKTDKVVILDTAHGHPWLDQTDTDILKINTDFQEELLRFLNSF